MADKIYTLPISPEQCQHEVYKVLGQVCEIVDDESHDVYAYRLEVSVHCVQCGMPFTFLGLPEGYNISEPMSNIDHTTARLPIKPLNIHSR
jgi:hypothetical protein